MSNATELTTAQISDAIKNAAFLPKEEEKISQKQRILRLAEGAELFHDKCQEAYATVFSMGYYQTYKIESSSFQGWIINQYLEETDDSPSSNALQEALNALKAKALYRGEKREVFLRTARVGDSIYIDLGRKDWKLVHITRDGWEIVNTADVKFRRSSNMEELPIPERGGKLEKLFQCINLQDQHEQLLVMAWLVAALWPDIPYPLLIIQGEQGTGKTFLSNTLRSIVDPNASSLRVMPRREEDLLVSANNNWVLAFDNLSGLSNPMSDALCRLSTGGGFSKRGMYTNDEEHTIEAQRPVIVNGIDDIASRPDLSDRAIILNLELIKPEERIAPTTLGMEIEQMRPQIIGGLCDAISAALRLKSDLPSEKCPRMVDYAQIGTALEQYTGWPPGTFLEAYNQNRNHAMEASIANNVLIQSIQNLLGVHVSWQGHMSDLYEQLLQNYLPYESARHANTWPKASNALSRLLKRYNPQLRHIGIEYISGRDNKGANVCLRKL